MEVSPSKRRVLGALDPNASSPKPQVAQSKVDRLDAVDLPLKRPLMSRQLEPELRKRPLVAEVPRPQEQQPFKKACLDESRDQNAATIDEDRSEAEAQPLQLSPRQSDRQPSATPEASSLFDSSGLDNTQDTAITEPDNDAPATASGARVTPLELLSQLAPTRPRLTQEQAREKAEILRLRLGLASYKVRTGQADVPLERLQIRPLPREAPPRTAPWGVHRSVLRQSAVEEDASASSTPSAHQPAATRRPLPGAPVRRGSEDEKERSPSAMSVSCSSVAEDGEGGGRRRAASIEENKPSQDGCESASSSQPQVGRGVDTTPKRRCSDGADEEQERILTVSSRRGGAASGLLSLARG
ncbi:hypothetical protein VTK73DRAFT_2167 [Phialemonium thermophilum]|uniref:Uncharacterized protein n=1 Tax=Phialemonium thermophilum TaxID=223376 RepID=A0ABR3X5T6_9PEZI